MVYIIVCTLSPLYGISRASTTKSADVSPEGDSGSASEVSEEDDSADRRPDSNTDLPSEYWQIQKLIKYLRVKTYVAILKRSVT